MTKTGKPAPSWVSRLSELKVLDDYVDSNFLCEQLGVKRTTLLVLIKRLNLGGDYVQVPGQGVRRRFRWSELHKEVKNYLAEKIS